MSEEPVPLGFGPMLACARGVPQSRRLFTKIVLAGFCAAFALFERWHGLNWWWSGGLGIALFAALYVANFAVRMRAGDGWFARDNSFVRTDDLVTLRARGTLNGLYVVMVDADGRSTYGPLSHLTEDQNVWDLVLAGVRTSVSRGLIVADNVTAHVFGVAEPPSRSSRNTRATKSPSCGVAIRALPVPSQPVSSQTEEAERG